MDYRHFSPFARPISFAHLQAAEAAVPCEPVKKWPLFRDLARAREAFGLTERDLTVLQALLSFLPGDSLDPASGLIVHAANATICDRLNGMPSSTMRRHLARLVETGILQRRDSPNGKRYVRRRGEDRIAYGLDLSPLLVLAPRIDLAARETERAEEDLLHLRETVSLMRRDLLALVRLGQETRPALPLWDQLHDLYALTGVALRRKPVTDALTETGRQLTEAIARIRALIEPAVSDDLSSTAAQSGHHQQSSNQDILESETCEDVAEGSIMPRSEAEEQISLEIVKEVCPTLGSFSSERIRDWSQFQELVQRLRPGLGIEDRLWASAQRQLGAVQASVVLAAMLERFAEIRSPGAYLHSLVKRAATVGFSCLPMIRALQARQLAA